MASTESSVLPMEVKEVPETSKAEVYLTRQDLTYLELHLTRIGLLLEQRSSLMLKQAQVKLQVENLQLKAQLDQLRLEAQLVSQSSELSELDNKLSTSKKDYEQVRDAIGQEYSINMRQASYDDITGKVTTLEETA